MRSNASAGLFSGSVSQYPASSTISMTYFMSSSLRPLWAFFYFDDEWRGLEIDIAQGSVTIGSGCRGFGELGLRRHHGHASPAGDGQRGDRAQHRQAGDQRQRRTEASGEAHGRSDMSLGGEDSRGGANNEGRAATPRR